MEDSNSHWLTPDSEEFRTPCFSCEEYLTVVSWNNVLEEVCLSCQGEEFASFLDAFSTEAGKKVLQIMFQDYVQPVAIGVPPGDPEFCAGQADVYWNIIRKMEIAERVRHGGRE